MGKNLYDLHNRDDGPTNSLDHGNMPLCHEGNLHDLYTGTWTTVCTAKGESRWSAEQLDHGDEPLRYDSEVDDLEHGLQLRRIRSFLQPVTKEDHGDRPLHQDRNVNDLEMQLCLLHGGT